MGTDTLSPVAPARVNALLLPVGKIRRSRFLSFAARLQAENVIRLGDVSPDPRPNRNMFTPLAFPTGLILYNLSFSVPPISHLELFPFEIFREPLVVLAIADGAELGNDSNDEESNRVSNDVPQDGATEKSPNPEGLNDLVRELSAVKEQNPRALVARLLIFEYHGVDKLTSGPDDIIWVPDPQSSRSTTIKTLLCDVTSSLLGEMDDFAKLLQAIPSIDSPRMSSWGPRRGPELRPRPVDKLLHRLSVPAQSSAATNGDSDSATSSGTASPAPGTHESPTTFDEITRSIQLASRSSSSGRPPSSKESSRDRMSVQGLTAADRTKARIRGRLGVVIGSLYLQAGRWPEALKELVEGTSMARASSDYVWHGKGLESILICLLMLGWAGMDFQIPQICYPVAEKTTGSKSSTSGPFGTATLENLSSGQTSPGNRLVSLQNLANLVPDLCNTIANLYARAAAITDEPLPPLVFSETIIRLSRLLAAIRVRNGYLDDVALRHIVTNEPLTPAVQLERPRGAPLLRKNDIAAFLFRALPNAPSAEIPTTDAVPILVGIASVLTYLDLPRKKAFVLKQLLSIVVPGLVEARKIGAAEVGIHPAAGLSSMNDTTFQINALDVGSGNLEQSTRALLTMIGETYGVQPSAFQERKNSPPAPVAGGALEAGHEYDSVASIVDRAFRYLSLDTYGDLLLKIEVLKASINFCEALPDFEGVLQYTVALLQTIRGELLLPETLRRPPALPVEDQVRLLNNIKRTVGAAQKLGSPDLEAEYWDDFLVRGVEVVEFPESRRPFRRSKTDLSAVTMSTADISQGPFLYTPFSKPVSKSPESLVIAKEPAGFVVTLQNPYEFDLEIDYIRLHSDNGALDAGLSGVLVPPLSLHEVLVPGVANTHGTLTIDACYVKVRHCRPRKFPIFSRYWKPSPESKIKRTGLDAKRPLSDRPLSWSSTTSKDGKVIAKVGPEVSTCPVKVIHPQPSVVIHSTSLAQSAIMILEGEKKTFDITLHNTSSCPVDFVCFTFQDSTMRQLQSALSNRDLLPAEVYELSLQLSTKPALRWLRHGKKPHDFSIGAGEKATFTIEVFGKPGLQDAVVCIDYGYLGTPRDEIPETFYTRQLSLSLTVTVNASVEIVREDIVPVSADFAWFNQVGQHAALPQPDQPGDNDQLGFALSRLGVGSRGTDYCLLILDLRNAWPNPLSVSFEVAEHDLSQDQQDVFTTTGHLQPGQVSRFVLVVPRIYVDNPHEAIPFLTTAFRRQYIVSTHQLSFHAEASSRETFWYREELLKRITGSWKEDSSQREGKIDIRTLQLSPRMVDALRLDDIEITFTLSPFHEANLDQEKDVAEEAAAVRQIRHCKFVAKTDEFLVLTTRIHNRSSRPICPLLRLQPSLCQQPSPIALDLSRRLAWTGMLQRTLPVLHGGETVETTVGLTVLCRGEYEIGASVEEVRLMSTQPAPSEQQPKAAAGAGGPVEATPITDTFGLDKARSRRVWHAREHCIILATD